MGGWFAEEEEGPLKVPAASTLGRKPHRRSLRLLHEPPGGRGSVGRVGGAAGTCIPPQLLLASAGPSAIHRPTFGAQCVLRGLPGCLAQTWAWRCRCCSQPRIRLLLVLPILPRGGKAPAPPAKAAGAPVLARRGHQTPAHPSARMSPPAPQRQGASPHLSPRGTETSDPPRAVHRPAPRGGPPMHGDRE